MFKIEFVKKTKTTFYSNKKKAVLNAFPDAKIMNKGKKYNLELAIGNDEYVIKEGCIEFTINGIYSPKQLRNLGVKPFKTRLV